MANTARRFVHRHLLCLLFFVELLLLYQLMQVVACLLVRGVECRIPLRVLCVVLLFQTGHQWLRVNLGLLWLHVRDRAHVLLADR